MLIFEETIILLPEEYNSKRIKIENNVPEILNNIDDMR